MQLTICDNCLCEEAGLVLENRDGAVSIPFRRIAYVEVFNKTVSFHMEDGTVREVTGALSDVGERLLDREEFVKTHRSYLVNLGCVREIAAGSAVTGAGAVPIARQRRAAVREAWLQFVQTHDASEEAVLSGGGKRPKGPWRILLVDDDAAELSIWAGVLREHGCIVDPAKSGAQALELAEREHFDAVLLDVMIPGEDGFSICERLREKLCAPIIFLSCVTESERQVEGFAAGGIDYITKDTPAGLFWTKLKTRIALAASERTQALYGPLLLDLTARKAFVDGNELSLTAVEFDILWLLSERAEHVFSPEEIFETVRGGQPPDGGKAALHAMSGLRRKLDRVCGHCFIEPVWGEGYRFIPPDVV